MVIPDYGPRRPYHEREDYKPKYEIPKRVKEDIKGLVKKLTGAGRKASKRRNFNPDK